MGDAYAATAQAIPAGPQYVAMGHIHAPQAVPGAPVPAHYAGSLLALDFGEAGEQKRVVDRRRRARPARHRREHPAHEGTPARSGSPTTGTRSRPALRSWPRRSSTSPCRTSGTDMTLADRAGEAFPYLVKVRALRPEGERPQHVAKGASDARTSSTPSTTNASTANQRPRSCSPCSATCSRRRPMRPLELTIEGLPLLPRCRPRSIGVVVAWWASSVRSAPGSPRSWMRSRSRSTARRRASVRPRSP